MGNDGVLAFTWMVTLSLHGKGMKGRWGEEGGADYRSDQSRFVKDLASEVEKGTGVDC